MTNRGDMTISGEAQGPISVGCSPHDSIGNTYESDPTDHSSWGEEG